MWVGADRRPFEAEATIWGPNRLGTGALTRLLTLGTFGSDWPQVRVACGPICVVAGLLNCEERGTIGQREGGISWHWEGQDR